MIKKKPIPQTTLKILGRRKVILKSPRRNGTVIVSFSGNALTHIHEENLHGSV